MRIITTFLLSVVITTLLANTTADEALKGARVSFIVQDTESGKVITSRNPNLCVVPASVTKLITTASAIEILGSNYRFSTHIEHDGYIDKNGTLHGNIIVRGGGDPTFGSAFLGSMNVMNEVRQKIQLKGIKKITGHIIADASVYNSNPVPITWCYEDVATHYGQGTYGLSYHDNICHITLESGEPGTRPRVLSVFPTIKDLLVETPVEVRSHPKDSFYIFGMPYDNKRIINGGMPANRPRYPVRCDMPNPPMLVAQHLKANLIANGVPVGGKATDSIKLMNDSIIHLFSYKSPQLREIIEKTNFKSNNMYAEHILRQLALSSKKNNISEGDGIAVLRKYWKRKGVNFDFTFLKDGSGMSPMNAYSAGFLNEILCKMTKSPRFEDFFNSLPIAGEEGTVKGFLRKTPLEGITHVKSGSMSHVQSYAGYIDYEGKKYAFTIIINNYNCKRSELRKIIAEMLMTSLGIDVED